MIPDLKDSVAFHSVFSLEATSNTLSGDFALRAFQGGFIDDDLKLHTLNGLNKSDNILGFQHTFSLLTAQPIGKGPWHFTTRYRHQRLAEATFSKSAFELAFLGNASTIGHELPFHLEYRNLNWQSLQLGIHYQKEQHTFGFSPGIVSSSYLSEASLKDATLYTNPDLSSMTLQANAAVSWSDTTGQHQFSTGKGVNFDVYYGYQTSKQEFFISIENFGMAYYDHLHLHDQTDSSWNFDGVSLNLFETEDFRFSVNQDSLKQWTGIRESGSKRIMLPSHLTAGFRQMAGERFELGLYGRYHFYSMARPEIHVLPAWKFHPQWKALLSIAHGGYGGLRSGMHMTAKLGNGFGLRFGSHNLLGMWIYQNTAVDFYISFYKF